MLGLGDRVVGVELCNSIECFSSLNWHHMFTNLSLHPPVYWQAPCDFHLLWLLHSQEVLAVKHIKHTSCQNTSLTASVNSLYYKTNNNNIDNFYGAITCTNWFVQNSIIISSSKHSIHRMREYRNILARFLRDDSCREISILREWWKMRKSPLVNNQ